MTALQTLVLAVFLGTYAVLCVKRHQRGVVAWIGVVILAVIERVSPVEILGSIHWNVIGIFAGTLILAEVFIESRMPVVIADAVLARVPTVGMGLLAICMISSALSIFVENVATVLIVAPIGIALARRQGAPIGPFLIGTAIASNLQGTATLIGDPPSMILAAWTKMNFNDFFVYKGRPGIFFAVQIGAIASFAVLYLHFRKLRSPIEAPALVRPTTLAPTILMGIMIVGLALAPIVDPEFSFAGGVLCMAVGLTALAWHARRWPDEARASLRRYDYDTTIFLAGIFALVHLLVAADVIDVIAAAMARLARGHELGAYVMLVTFSVVVSAFVDNVPYITAMLPVSQSLAQHLGAPPEAYLFGVLIGSCLGGNITPLGAAANVVATGLARKNGEPISFREFIRIGLPFTIAATVAAAAFIWWIWGP